jgi:hypothetical protein
MLKVAKRHRRKTQIFISILSDAGRFIAPNAVQKHDFTMIYYEKKRLVKFPA